MKLSAICTTLPLLSSFALAGVNPPADVILDHFDDPFPVQVLPNVQLPLLFVGTLDGVTHTNDFTQQNGLPGVLGGERDTNLQGFNLPQGPGGLVTSLCNASLMSYSSGFGPNGILTVEYGVRTSLNLDASFGHALSVRGINGDMDDSNPVRPVPLTITLASGVGGSALGIAQSVTVIVINDGDYVIGYDQFPLIDFTDLDSITFSFDVSQQQAVDFAFDSFGIVPVEPNVQSFCEGDGSNVNGGADCPCGNNGNPGEGCDNGSGFGALLTASGVPSVSNDTLQLQVSQIQGSVPGIFFASTAVANNGDGLDFGMGLRCLLQVTRLAKIQGNGTAPVAGAPTLSVYLGVQPGDTTYFQHFYRNPNGPCGQNFGANTSNALEVTWGL